jgi:hypothetical protein
LSDPRATPPGAVSGEMLVFVASETRRPVAEGASDGVGGGRRSGSPNYFDMLPKPVSSRVETRAHGTRSIMLETRAYPSGIVVSLVRERVPDVFSLELRARREELANIARENARAEGCSLEDPEEYAMFCVSEFEGDPGRLIDAHRHSIAQLLKSEDQPLHEDEVAATIGHALRYGQNDRVIVDWDGAFLFDSIGDFAGDIDVLEIANRTLLRYRLLDRKLNVYLEEAVAAVKDPPRSFFGSLSEVRKRMRVIAEIRLLANRELGRIDGDIKLYGNWYLARVYELASRIFHIEDWRRIVTSSVEQLEQLYQMVAENFSIRRTERLEFLQLLGWTVLLAGYFLLFFLEASRTS